MTAFYILVSSNGTILADATTADEATTKRHGYRDMGISATVYHCQRVVGEPVESIAAAFTEVMIPQVAA